jgi:hypothetical protein
MKQKKHRTFKAENGAFSMFSRLVKTRATFPYVVWYLSQESRSREDITSYVFLPHAVR